MKAAINDPTHRPFVKQNVTMTKSFYRVDSTDDNKDLSACRFINLHEDATGIALTLPHTIIPESWILLDNQTMVDVFYNAILLLNIRQVDETMTIYSNSGVTSTNISLYFTGNPINLRSCIVVHGAYISLSISRNKSTIFQGILRRISTSMSPYMKAPGISTTQLHDHNVRR
jgi:hypothetical protein